MVPAAAAAPFFAIPAADIGPYVAGILAGTAAVVLPMAAPVAGILLVI